MQAIAPTTSPSHEDTHPMNNTNLKDHNIIPPNDDKFTKQNITQVEPHNTIIRALKHNSIHTDIRPTSIRVQVDGGAKRSITNNTALLTGYKNIKIYPLNGVSTDGPAIYCTSIGYLPWKSDTYKTVFIKCYYSRDAAETIISPTDVVIDHIKDIHAWGQYCDMDTNQGWIKFYYRNQQPPITFILTNINNLWYHEGDTCTIEDYNLTEQHIRPYINRLTNDAQYELYHHVSAILDNAPCPSYTYMWTMYHLYAAIPSTNVQPVNTPNANSGKLTPQPAKQATIRRHRL
jgi:hypothetical protein